MRYSIFLIAVLCCFSGCGGGSGSSQSASNQGNSGQSGSGQSGSSAKFRVIIGSWAVPTDLTIIINGTTVATGISYTMCLSNEVCPAQSAYLTVPSGGVDFAIHAPGSSSNLVPSQFQKLNLSPNTQNTFVLSGGTTDIVGYLFLDDSTPASGSVKLRIAFVTDWLGGVSAWVNPNGSSTGNPNLSAQQGAASSYLTLSPGPYFVTFSLPCGFLTTPNCVVTGPITFAANQNITVYVLYENDDNFLPLILADNGAATVPIPANATATLTVYQEAATFGTVQVSWNGQTEAKSLAFQKNTGALSVQAGTGTLEITGPNVFVPGTEPGQASVISAQEYLTPNTTNDFIIFGSGPYTWGTALLTADTTPAQGSAAQLRVENCQLGPQVDVYILPSGKTLSGNPTYTALGCASSGVGGATPTYQVLSPNTYDIFVTMSGTTQVLYKTTVTLAPNQNRTLVVLVDCMSSSSCDLDTLTSLLLDDLN